MRPRWQRHPERPRGGNDIILGGGGNNRLTGDSGDDALNSRDRVNRCL
ncbi:MAG: hypothetical protein ACR2KW_08185 [Rubrobacter sp.]